MRNKLFRIFVSSTFKDFQLERNALRNRVFPQLRALCAQHNCQFQAIDLRWGITDEESRLQRAVDICLKEVDHCQRNSQGPNFLCLLGDRYGWRPLPSAIPLSEWNVIKGQTCESELALLNEWYLLDKNEDPPAYLLKPRSGEFLHQPAWEGMERRIQDILFRAASLGGLAKSDLLKYNASLTEQEIARGVPVAASVNDRAFCFIRMLSDDPARSKWAAEYVDLNASGAPDRDTQTRLRSMKERLKLQLPDENIINYSTSLVHGEVTAEYLDRFCIDLYSRLSRRILQEIDTLESISWIDRERVAHTEYAESLTSVFVGREDILESIDDYLTTDIRHPLVITGAAGSGKSAIMARAFQRIKGDRNMRIIVRFIGATPTSTNVDQLVIGLCQEIHKLFDFDTVKRERLAGVVGEDKTAKAERTRIESDYAIPDDLKKQPDALARTLRMIPREGRVVLFLDGLDQISLSDHLLHWLPLDLPEQTKIVVSIADDNSGDGVGVCGQPFGAGVQAPNVIRLEALSVDVGETLLDAWLVVARRKLQPKQRREVLKKFSSSGMPLYLRLAFEEARHWRSDAPPVSLGTELVDIVSSMLARLEDEGNHGKVLTSRALGYIAAARRGLVEDELMDVLSSDNAVMSDFRARATSSPAVDVLPVVVWLRLAGDLDSFLIEHKVEGASVLTFYHHSVSAIVAHRYLDANGSQRRETHERLASYFAKQTNWHDSVVEVDSASTVAQLRTPNVRKAVELPWQLARAHMYNRLAELLTDLLFIESKCAAGLTADLLSDYATATSQVRGLDRAAEDDAIAEAEARAYGAALKAFASGESDVMPVINSVRFWTGPEAEEEGERIQESHALGDRLSGFARFVRRSAATFIQFAAIPGLVVQQANNSADRGSVAKAAMMHPAMGDNGPPMLLTQSSERSSCQAFSALLGVFDGHEDEVSGVAMTADGRRAVSVSTDKTLRVWDLPTGRCVRVEPTSAIHCVAMTPDGRRAVAGGFALEVWDLEAGRRLQHIEDLRAPVYCLSITADARLAVTGSCHHFDGSKELGMRVWNLLAGICIRQLPAGEVSGVFMTSDGHKAFAGTLTGQLTGWDLVHGYQVSVLNRGGLFSCVTGTPDGATVLAGTHDGVVVKMDVRENCGYGMDGHGDAVRGLGITADGRWAVSGGEDGKLIIWDVSSRRDVRRYHGSDFWVTAVSVTPDGRRVLSGSGGIWKEEDPSLRLWDVMRGTGADPSRDTPGEVEFQSLSLAPDSSVLLSVVQYASEVAVLDSRSGRRVRALPVPDVEGALVTLDGQQMVTWSGERKPTLEVRDLATGRQVQRLKQPPKSQGSTGAAFTPDGGRIILAGPGLYAACAKTGQWLWGYGGAVTTCFAVSPDGRLALAGNLGGRVTAINIATGEQVLQISTGTTMLGGLDVSPDGRLVAAGGQDGVVRVWDLVHGSLVCAVECGATLRAIQFTPDGRHVLSGGYDQTVRLWNIRTRECCAAYPTDSINKFCGFTAEGHFVIGTSSGQVEILRLHRVALPALATAVQLCRHPKVPGGLLGRFKPIVPTVDAGLTARCPHCGNRFELTRPQLIVVTTWAGLAEGQSPCLTLPDRAWKASDLADRCPLCDKALRLNPFAVLFDAIQPH